MEDTNNILIELNEISPMVAKIGKVNVFSVPQGYFEAFETSILTAVNQSSTPNLITHLPKQNAMQVPQGYFESLADNILQKIKLQQSKTEGQELPAMLQNIKSINVFTVPQNYFELLPAKILATVQPAKAKVITMQRRTASIFKYAAAAVFTGVMALGVYKYSNTDATKNNLPGYVADGMKIKNVDAELANVKDADIINYLKDNGENLDVALVSNTIDATDLPNADDYLFDDNALDKYLDNAELKN